MAFRIGEESERDAAWHLNRWLNGLATEAFDLVQCRLRVVNTNVERDVPRTLWRFADPLPCSFWCTMLYSSGLSSAGPSCQPNASE